MAKAYRLVLRDQPFLLPPDMREWLAPDHPVWLVIAAVADHLDTRALHAGRRAGGAGAAGYDPDMLIMVLVWAYAHRVTSSRRIEELCRTDIAFRVICAGDVPDHVTIARFRAQLGGAAAAFFTQVLVLCARLGMGRVGLVALDGMKIAASASKSANRTRGGLEKLAADIAAAHAETDAAEDALFGPGVRGDEVPAELADPRTRDERIAAALADLEAEDAAAEQAAARAAADYLAGPGKPGRPPARAREAAARARLEAAIAARQARAGAWQARAAARRVAGGRGQGLPGNAPKAPGDCDEVIRARAALDKARAAGDAREESQDPAPVRNVTDPHSRLMPVRGGGFIQGYNTQNVTSEDGLIIATALTAGQNDAPWFEPMLRQAEAAATLIASARPGPDGDATAGQIGLFLADAGYLSEANLTCDGPDRLIATGKRRDLEKQAAGQSAKAARANPAITAMAERLATTEGITAYRQRSHIAETPHGHLKHNMGLRQLSLRGKTRATAEWNLACAVHNMFKAINAGHLTAVALAALAS